MDTFIRFTIAHEAGIRFSQFDTTPTILMFEAARKSAWADDADDPGGKTMCGVTIATYTEFCRRNSYPTPSAADLREIPFIHWSKILKSMFWDKANADSIQSKPIAYMITDWIWASGPAIIRHIQRLVNTTPDGIAGPLTTAAINAAGERALFEKIRQERIQYIDRIIRRNPRLSKFRKGWLRRIDEIPQP